MGFKLGSEKRGFRIPGKSNSPFIKRNKFIPENPYYEGTDWSITKDDGKKRKNFDLEAEEGSWWYGPQSDGNYGGEDSSQIDGKSRWSHKETDDSTYGYGPGGDKDPKKHPQFRNKKYIIGAQSKWKTFAKGFDPAAGRKSDGRSVVDMSAEEITQKEIAEKLYTMANKDVASTGPTTAGMAAQGAHFEAAYHSKEFRDFVKMRVNELERRGGNPNELMIDDLHKWR